MYHSSVRTQRRGSRAVEASRAATSIAAGWIGGWLRKYAPTSSPYQGQPYSVSAAEWTPAYPPPAADVALERRLLRVVEDVAGREQEDDGVVAGEPRRR